MRTNALLFALFFPGIQAFAASVDFVRDIRPILEARCYSCHGEDKQSSGLRLDLKTSAFTKGDGHAPNILPGQANKSPLIRFVKGEDPDLRMPPKGKPLSEQELTLLTRWIDDGAHWPDGIDNAKVIDKLDHWSFKPLTHPELPAVKQSHWPRNGIDNFILATLESKGLTPSPEADRVTWIRRVYFNLIGLPPTPAEVQSFLNDTRPDAHEHVVDHLLNSPHYGERWARHWLDVIAFGETHGFEVNTPRDNAWPYRDYVIEAFNRDIPYPQFIKDQLAGDLTGKDPATGLMVAAAALLPGQIGKDLDSQKLARQDELNSMVLISSSAFLGLTVNCARCHDHKFDPVSQEDYYAMQAIFAGVHHGERPWLNSPPKSDEDRKRISNAKQKLLTLDRQIETIEAQLQNSNVRPRVNARLNTETFPPVKTRSLRFTILETNKYEPCLDEIEIFGPEAPKQNLALAKHGTKASSSGDYPRTQRHKLEHINDGRFGNDRSWISNEKGKGWVKLDFPSEQTIDRVVWARDREGRYDDRLPINYRIEVLDSNQTWQTVASSESRRPFQSTPTEIEKQLFALQEQRQQQVSVVQKAEAVPMVYAGRFEPPEPIHLLHRGDPAQPRQPIKPGALSQIGPKLNLPADATDQQRRLALADWIADPRHPLTARVMVNRLWQFHFGEGLVDTPSDFGRNGTKPIHPELLDWLASEFIKNGWSLKAMHRVITLSATYRQSSQPNQAGLAKDAACRLLWRFPPRRMEAEVMRDTMLTVCGTLDLRMGGPGYSVFAPNNNYVRVYDPKTEYGPGEWRRMIYQTKVRMAQDSTFGTFDCPDAGLPQPKRARSTTPLQALNLLNSQFVNQQADYFAQRLQHETPDHADSQITRAFQLAFNRDPDPAELSACRPLIAEHGLTAFCRMLLNTSEFVFIP